MYTSFSISRALIDKPIARSRRWALEYLPLIALLCLRIGEGTAVEIGILLVSTLSMVGVDGFVQRYKRLLLTSLCDTASPVGSGVENACQLQVQIGVGVG